MLFVLSILSWLMCQVVLSPVPQNGIFQYINDHQDEYVQRLKDWVAVESDSSDPEKRDLVNHMMQLTKDFIVKLGGKVEMVELGEQEHPSGKKIILPPVILAEIGNDPNKPTVCFYGHVDVQSAKKEDGWLTEPYTVVEKDGNLYGRGTSDDKGQILALLHAVEAVNTIGIPVNVKFIIEGMEEVGSDGLDKLVEDKKDTFLSNVDYIVVTDTPWLSKKPGITYGARGNCYFILEVQGARRDLHSGGFGGTVYEAMSDLIYLLDTLVDVKGHILIPGIYDAVAPLNEKEIKLYKELEFNLKDLEADTGISKFLHDTKEELLLYRWRYPSLSIHGIEGAFSGTGTKTVIPAKVIGKFSIRQVPNMNPSVVEKQVADYLQSKFAERKSPNKINVTMVIGAKPWLADMNEPQYLAARKAVKRVFNTDADMIRAGGTIPIAKNFEEVLGKSVMLLGIGGPDDAAHGQNEKISKFNYIEGTKLYAAFLQELASI
ncbi:beta-Ala-His dipeptidase-like [Pelobates cultripes]|uniref:Beta-Ala-His dipeptidase-like n=1 Tax=Pelobates cultripes TaxID=61616 RepID=A0AAD1W2Y0_PELCU|nr:beta-Ala-His dipeptidase-like [Pelobates cultripes]